MTDNLNESNAAPPEPQGIIWNAKNIGGDLGLNERQVNYQVESGQLHVGWFGKRMFATVEHLREQIAARLERPAA